MRAPIFVIVAVMLPLAVFAATPKKKVPPPPPPPPTNPPSITLALTANAPDQGWAMHVTNTGLEPLRIVADARALSLEITPAGGGAMVRCSLPAEMRPLSDNTSRTLVLVGGRSYTERFDPRLYCFAAHDAAALTLGATVVGKLGFAPTNLAPPYEVTWALDGTTIDASAAPSPAKEVVSAPVTLAAAPVADAGAPIPAAATDGIPVHLAIAMPARLDVATTFEQQTSLSVTNKDPRPVSLLLRPSTTGFIVDLPQGGQARCGAPAGMTAISELLTTLPANGGRTSVTVDIDSLCPDVFSRPGLYVVRPRIDTRRVTGSVSSYRGEAIGDPSLIRVRTGRGDDRASPKIDPPH